MWYMRKTRRHNAVCYWFNTLNPKPQVLSVMPQSSTQTFLFDEVSMLTNHSLAQYVFRGIRTDTKVDGGNLEPVREP